MQRSPIPPWRLLFSLLATVLCSEPTRAQAFDDLRGFELGRTFADAERHARERGWTLKPLSPELPGNWVVAGTNLGLFYCDNKISSISTEQLGGLEEFAMIAGELGPLQAKYGKPETQIIAFMAGTTRISNVAARFTVASGVGTHVTFTHSGDGPSKIVATFYLDAACPEKPGR